MRSADALWRYAVCVGVGALLVLLLGPAWQTGFPATFPDSASYVAVADAGLLSTDFWFGDRPPTYPLLIWLVGPSARAVVVTQTLLAVLAWGWLVATAWRSIRSLSVAAVAASLLVLMAVQTRWIFWHTALLTESLSTTLAVAGVAAWWRWWVAPDRFRIGVAVVITSAWMLLRDSNAVTFTVVAVPAFVVVLLLDRRRTSPRRQLMIGALAVVVAVGAYSITAQVLTDRGETSFHNNVGLRWLPDADMTGWMEDRGMPLTPALRARTGADAWADGEAMLRSPDLAEYRAWARGRGRLAAAESFVVRADWYLDRLTAELPGHTATDLRSYDTFDVGSRFPERTLGWIDPIGSRAAVFAWLAMSLASAILLWVRRRTTGWFAWFLLVPVVGDVYLSFVADGVEVSRHLIGPLHRFAVVTVVLVALAASELVSASPDDDEPLSRAAGPIDAVAVAVAEDDAVAAGDDDGEVGPDEAVGATDV